MKTTEQIIKHIEVSKSVFQQFVEDAIYAVEKEVEDGLQLPGFVHGKMTNIAEWRSKIEELDELLIYIKEE